MKALQPPDSLHLQAAQGYYAANRARIAKRETDSYTANRERILKRLAAFSEVDRAMAAFATSAAK